MKACSTAPVLHFEYSNGCCSSPALKQECCYAVIALSEADLVDISIFNGAGFLTSLTGMLRWDAASAREAAVTVIAHLCGSRSGRCSLLSWYYDSIILDYSFDMLRQLLIIIDML